MRIQKSFQFEVTPFWTNSSFRPLYKRVLGFLTRRQTGFTFERRQTGFTLIEILVVFSIVSILSGIGIAAFASYSRSQQLNQSANNIKLLIGEARFNSLSAVKTNRNPSGDTVSCGNETLIGYSVTVVGSDQLEMDLLCANLNPATVKLMSMPKGYTFSNATTCSAINFASLTSTTGGLPCQLVLNGNGQTKTISIDAIGNTSIN